MLEKMQEEGFNLLLMFLKNRIERYENIKYRKEKIWR